MSKTPILPTPLPFDELAEVSIPIPAHVETPRWEPRWGVSAEARYPHSHLEGLDTDKSAAQNGPP